MKARRLVVSADSIMCRIARIHRSYSADDVTQTTPDIITILRVLRFRKTDPIDTIYESNVINNHNRNDNK